MANMENTQEILIAGKGGGPVDRKTLDFETRGKIPFRQVNQQIIDIGKGLDEGKYQGNEIQTHQNLLDNAKAKRTEYYEEIKDMGFVDVARTRIAQRLQQLSSEPEDAWDRAKDSIEAIAPELEHEAQLTQ